MTFPTLTVRPLTPDWDLPALRRLGEILFRTSPSPKRARQIDRFVDLLGSRRLKREGVLLAFQGDLLVGTILAETMPGASGLLWLPQVIVSQSVSAIEDALVRAAIHRLRLDRVKSIQTFLSPEEFPAGESLLRNGFRHLTHVWTMRREVGSVGSEVGTTDFRPVTSSTLPSLIDTLVRTYEGSLDCPELDDRRTLDEIRDGLLASSPELDLWWLLRSRDENAGVLILGRDGDRCEVHYLGVVPRFRRLGIATDAVRFASRRALEWGVAEVSLLVDSRNQPAIQLYRRHGFGIDGSREVFLLRDS